MTKSFNAGNSGFNGTFDIDVNCDIDSLIETVTLPAGQLADDEQHANRYQVRGVGADVADGPDGLDVRHAVVQPG